jgi:predicted ester cyclase
LAAGDEVAFRWTFSGTHRGALGAVPATLRQVRVPGCIAIVRLAAGKVERLHMSWDRYELLQQLGVLPATAPAAQA